MAEVESCEIVYRDRDGQEHRGPLRDLAGPDIHLGQPVRRPPAFRRQLTMPGLYWFATGGRHIVYESRLELDRLLILDFDLAVKSVAAQPFRLNFRSPPLSHIPDFLVLEVGDRAKVVDVSPQSSRDKPKRRVKFELTAIACREVGWQYVIESEPQPTYMTNLRGLAGFRRDTPHTDRFEADLLSACSTATTIGRLSDEVGPRALVRPVLFHLLWKQRLRIDLMTPMTDGSRVTRAEAGPNAV